MAACLSGLPCDVVSCHVRGHVVYFVLKAVDVQFGVLLHELSAVESPRQRHLRPLKIPEEAPPEIADLINR